MSAQQGAPSMHDLMAQATAMANQGGPGANSAAAETWLTQQAEKYGYTKSATTPTADNSGSYDFYGGGISGGVSGTVGTPPDSYDASKDPEGQPGAVDGMSWIETHAANYGLVLLGAALVLGALLISQKQTIVEVGKLAAVAA